MSEIRFECPGCGQHLAATTAHAGQTIPCPACQKSVTVPGTVPADQPASASAPLPPPLPPPIGAPPPRSAPPRASGPGPATPARSGSKLPLIVALVVVGVMIILGLGVAGFFYLRASQQNRIAEHGIRVSPPQHFPPASGEIRRQEGPRASRSARVAEEQVATDPSQVEIPEGPVSGLLHGNAFEIEKARVQNGVLTLTGPGGVSDELMIFMFISGSPAGRTFLIPQASGTVPHVHLRYKEEGRTRSDIVARSYAMRLEFGQEEDGKVPGKIFLETPERFNTKITGTFEAELR